MFARFCANNLHDQANPIQYNSMMNDRDIIDNSKNASRF